MGQEQELPLKSVVLFIAAGTLVFIIVFIFAKRQITRFAVKSSRGPHVSVGADAPKSLRQEIEKSLKRAAEFHFEPILLTAEKEEELRPIANTDQCHYYYRMKAMDALSLLEDEVRTCCNTDRQLTGRHLRQSLLELQSQGLLTTAKPDLIRNFIDSYEHARHDPEIFGEDEYTNYMVLLRNLILCVHGSKNGSINTPDIKQADFGSLNKHGYKRDSAHSRSDESIPETEPMMKKTVCEENVKITYRPSGKTPKAGVLRLSQRASSGSSLASHHSNVSFASKHSTSHTHTAV